MGVETLEQFRELVNMCTYLVAKRYPHLPVEAVHVYSLIKDIINKIPSKW